MKFFTERSKTPELKKNLIEASAVEKGVEGALARVRKLASGEDGTRRLEYHTEAHTATVIARYKKILAFLREAGMNIDERDEQVGELGAAFHDTIRIKEEQDFTEESGAFEGYKRRGYQPMNGVNESASGSLAELYMKDVNKDKPDTFTEEDMQKIKTQIMVTDPAYDPELHTVVQPNLTEQSSAIDRALALADLGNGAGGGQRRAGDGGLRHGRRRHRRAFSDAGDGTGAGDQLRADDRHHGRRHHQALHASLQLPGLLNG